MNHCNLISVSTIDPQSNLTRLTWCRKGQCISNYALETVDMEHSLNSTVWSENNLLCSHGCRILNKLTACCNAILYITTAVSWWHNQHNGIVNKGCQLIVTYFERTISSDSGIQLWSSQIKPLVDLESIVMFTELITCIEAIEASPQQNSLGRFASTPLSVRPGVRDIVCRGYFASL